MKIMKKSLALALALLMVFSLLPAAAAADGGAVISVSSAETSAGETVTLDVSIASNPGFVYGVFEVEVPDGLTLTAITKGAAAGDGTLSGNTEANTFSVDNLNNDSDFTADGVLAVMSFAVDEEAAAGDYSVSLKLGEGKDSNFANYNEEVVPVSFTAGKVTVSAPEHVHSLTAHEASEATPSAAGNSAYWSCEGCGKFFSDDQGENEIEENSWIIPATAHDCVDEDHDHKCDICEADYNRAPVLAEGVKDVTANVVTGEAYLLRELQTGKIFEDPDGDPLFLQASGANGSTSTSYYYQRSTDGGQTWGAEQDFASSLFGATTISLTETKDGTYMYRIYAKDGYGGSSADEGIYWNLTLTFLPADQIPFDISFYISQDQNYKTNGNVYPVIRLWPSDGNSNKAGEEISFSEGSNTVENGYNKMYATVPGGWYVYEGYGWNAETKAYDIPLGGMQIKLPADSNVDGNAGGGTDIYLRLMTIHTASKKADNTYFSAADYSVRITCPIMNCDAVMGEAFTDGNYAKYPVLFYAGGNSCLFNYYLNPTDTDNYIFNQQINQTLSPANTVQAKNTTISSVLTLTVTVPQTADFGLYFQYNNFNASEQLPVSDWENNEDGTKTASYHVSKSNGNYTWRMTDTAGKYVTRAGWMSQLTASTSVSYTFEGGSTDVNGHSFSGIGSTTISRDEADLQVFVSSTGAMAAGSASQRIRAYRMWELINSDTANIMIEPDYVWTKLSGPASVSFPGDGVAVDGTQVDGGNGYHNWADVSANGGTSIFAVHYNALDVDRSNNTTHGGFYPATNPDRTSFVVIADTLGSATANVAFNGDFESNARLDGWDYIYDTWYYLDTDEDPVMDFTVNGAVSVEVAYGVTNWSMGSSVSHFTALKSEDDVYSASLSVFNSSSYNYGGTVIIRMKDASGNYSYQLVRVHRMSVSAENQSHPGEAVMPGDTVKLSYSGLYRSVNKIAGIFNPTTFYLCYSTEGTETKGSLAQYQRMDNSSISLVIPEDIAFEENASETTCEFSNGYVYGSMYSASNPFGAMYYMTDYGVGTNFNAVTVSFAFQHLADIPVTVSRSVSTKVTMNIVGGEEPEVIVKNAAGETMIAEDGIFSLPYGEYSLSVTAEGFRKATGSFTVGSADNGEKTVTVTLSALTGSEWDGTSAEPALKDGVYQISNGQELAWFAQQVNVGTGANYNAVLTCDIELNCQTWTPIGNNSKKYSGIFDGQGHWVTGLYCNGDNYQGLFGYLNSATVKNLGVSGEIIAGKNAGGIAGYGAGTSVIDSCVNKCSVTGTATSGNMCVGGICGNLGAKACTISNCYNLGAVSGYGKYVGGINGGGTNTALSPAITNCYNLGLVTSTTGQVSSGAIACNAAVTNSYYLEGCTNGTKILGASVKENELKALAGTLGSAFKDDAGMINNGFPVLAWEKSEHTHNYVNGACACGDTIPSVDEEGRASATVSENTVVEENKELVVNASTGNPISGAGVTLPAAVVENIGKASSMTVNTDAGSMTFDNDALNRIRANSDGDVLISIAVLDVPATLETEDENAILVEVSASSNGKQVFSGSGMGSVTVSVPYSGTVGEDEQLNVYYINGSKRVRVPAVLSNGVISFTVSHFSEYLVSKQGADEGYSVAADGDKSVTPGENVNFAVTVANADANVTAYNAYKFIVDYDPSMLTYTGVNVTDNIRVSESDPAGTLTVAGFGVERSFSDKLTLSFTAKTVGESEIRITDAWVDAAANADMQDAPRATITANITTVTVSNYTVTLPEGFTGNKTAASGSSYTFTANDANYIYELSATMGGSPVEVRKNEDGSFTVENVSGNLSVTVESRTGKTVGVASEGNGKAAVAAAAEAVYGTDFSFTLTEENFYNYTITVTIGGEAYTGYKVSGSTYTIPGSALTGDVSISVTKTYSGPGGNRTVNVSDGGAEDVDAPATATEGEDYSFTVTKEDGFDYTVTVSIGGVKYELADPVEDGNVLTYTIPGADLSGNISISVEKTAAVEIEVHEYIKLDGQSIWLVIAKSGAMPEGKTLGYDGNAMYSSEKYGGYAWLVMAAGSAEDVLAEAETKVAQMNGSSAAVDYSGDVNGTELVDVNDAQLVYNMYNAVYDSFDSVSVAKFLAADVADLSEAETDRFKVDVADAAAIAAQIISH